MGGCNGGGCKGIGFTDWVLRTAGISLRKEELFK